MNCAGVRGPDTSSRTGLYAAMYAAMHSLLLGEGRTDQRRKTKCEGELEMVREGTGEGRGVFAGGGRQGIWNGGGEVLRQGQEWEVEEDRSGDERKEDGCSSTWTGSSSRGVKARLEVVMRLTGLSVCESFSGRGPDSS